MELIEYSPRFPIGSNRGPLHKLRGLLPLKRLSRAGKRHVSDLLELETVEELEDERHLNQLERKITVADGEIRAQEFLLDEQAKFRTLRAIRKANYAAAKGHKQINVINDFARQTKELLRRRPHLKNQVEEMERQFVAEVAPEEEIS